MSPVILLVAKDDHGYEHHTVPLKERRPYFGWGTSSTRAGKNLHLDCYQIMVYPDELQTRVDPVLCPYFNKVPDSTGTGTCTCTVYVHKSLHDGVFHAGMNRHSESDQSLDILINEHPPVYAAGLVLDVVERRSDHIQPFIDDNMPWRVIHPSNITTNCFSNYGLVDIRGLQKLRITLLNVDWLDLDEKILDVLDRAGQHYFPLIIHPFYMDSMKIWARWQQPTNYPELYEEIITHTSRPARPCKQCTSSEICAKCRLPYLDNQYSGSEEIRLLHNDIMRSYVVKKNMQYLYDNQTREGICAAYTYRGDAKLCTFLNQDYRESVLERVRREGYVIPVA